MHPHPIAALALDFHFIHLVGNEPLSLYSLAGYMSDLGQELVWY